MKTILSLVLVLFLFDQYCFGSELELEDADTNVSDMASLKRGAKHFLDYCAGCHSIRHLRYARIASDFGLDEVQFRKQGLILGKSKFLDTLEGAMHPEDSKDWMGVEPPDLSLIARAKGADWLFTYLKTFYNDSDRPNGSNNLVSPNVGMPNVLWQLQGIQLPIYSQRLGEEKKFERMRIVREGTMTADEFNQFINDLVGFLEYCGEPNQFQRRRVGTFVLIGLVVFAVLLFKLKNEFWRDIS